MYHDENTCIMETDKAESGLHFLDWHGIDNLKLAAT